MSYQEDAERLEHDRQLVENEREDRKGTGMVDMYRDDWIEDDGSDDDEEIVLSLTPGEASALSYFIAFAALKHMEKGDGKLTSHEDAMVTKVSKLDPEAYRQWQEAVFRAAGGS